MNRQDAKDEKDEKDTKERREKSNATKENGREVSLVAFCLPLCFSPPSFLFVLFVL